MLRQRIRTACLITVPVLLFLAIGGLPLVLLGLVLFVVLNVEFLTMATELRGRELVPFILALFLQPAGYAIYAFPGLCVGTILATMFTLMLGILSVAEGKLSPAVTSGSISAVCYPSFFATLLVVLAGQPHAGGNLFWLLAVVVATDTAAYFAGKRWGTTKLCELVSPQKTIVGALFGLLGAVLVSILVGPAAGIQGGWLSHAAFGILIGVLAEFGDLAESLLKRHYGVKDAGSILPGHGGLLDRVDGLLFAAPALFVLQMV